MEASQIKYKSARQVTMSETQTELRKLNAGRTATIFKYTDVQVLKVFRTTFPQEAINEEYKIGLYLNHAHLDTPHTYSLMDVDGSPAIVFEYIPGQSMLQKLARSPWRVFTYSKQMARLHSRIHSLRVSDSDLSSLKESLTSKILRAPLLTTTEKEIIILNLSRLKDGNAICHGDFHPDNIIVARNRLVTVDWNTARFGNPIADVARTWLLLAMGTLPENKTKLEILLATYLRDLFCSLYVKEYRKITHFSVEEFEAWKLPIAAARLIENVSFQENQNLLKFIRMRLASTRV